MQSDTKITVNNVNDRPVVFEIYGQRYGLNGKIKCNFIVIQKITDFGTFETSHIFTFVSHTVEGILEEAQVVYQLGISHVLFRM